MTLSTTASGNINKKKSWSGMRKHMEHDPNLKHKNEYLNTDESKQLRKYNSHKVLINFDDWAENKFGDFVKEHDETMKDRRRKFKSVKRFLEVDGNGNERKVKPLMAYTEKLSNEADWHDFRDDLIKRLQHYTWTSGNKKGQFLTADEAKDMAYKTIEKGLEKYADGFNDRNKNLFMFEYYTHLDEEGSPHLHSDVMAFVEPTGKTKTGKIKKPSTSLNRALAEQYNNKGKSKENLKRFREQEDQALIDAMNDTLENQLGIKNAFELVRKTDVDKALETGLDHEVYKARATAIKKQEQQKQANQAKINEQNKTLDEQAKTLAENQSKLDDLDNYASLISTAKNDLADLKKQQEEAESKRDDAISARKQAENDARLANYVVIQQVNKRNKELDEKEEKQKARERDLNARELGGTDSNGNMHKGLIQRESALDEREQAVSDREDAVTSKENKLADYDEQLASKKNELSKYSSTLEQKKKKVLAKKNQELREAYTKSKQAYERKLDDIKAKNATGSKFLTYASYIYHSCAETFIKTVAPEYNVNYDKGHNRISKHTMAYDLARGQYKSVYDDVLSGNSSLDNCLLLATSNKKNLWKAIKATGKKFMKLVNTKQVKDVVKQLDVVDEQGLNDEAVSQATIDDMQQEQARQAQLDQERREQKERLKNTQFHVDTRNKRKDIDDEFKY